MSKKRLFILLVALGVAAGTFACSEALNPQPLPPSSPEQGGSAAGDPNDKAGEPTSGTSSSSGGSSSGSATPGDAGGADATGDATFGGDGGNDASTGDDATTGKD